MNIDAFVAQPYPLEHSTDGETWQLVVGWVGEGEAILPVLASELPGHYRQVSPVNATLRVSSASSPVAPARRAPRPA